MIGHPEKETAGVSTPTLPLSRNITLIVNGAEKQLAVAPWTTLLDLLREYLDLTGTKKAGFLVVAQPMVGSGLLERELLLRPLQPTPHLLRHRPLLGVP